MGVEVGTLYVCEDRALIKRLKEELKEYK
jgi:hypothetical protein